MRGVENWHWVWLFVDSGATYSILHSDVATRLGLKSDQGKKVQAVVGDGKTISVCLQQLEVSLQGKTFSATVGFSDELKVGFNLLGRQDFFERFRVCLSDHYREVTFTETAVSSPKG